MPQKPGSFAPCRSFCGIQYNNKKLLLPKRSETSETDPGRYAFLGEHLASGEFYIEGLNRGLREELSITKYHFKELGKHTFKYDKQAEKVKLFLVFIESSDIKLKKDAHTKYKWLTKEELLEITDNLPELTRHWIKTLPWFRQT